MAFFFDRPKNIYWGKSFFEEKNIFLEVIYQLKKTSDYSQNDPPGPEQNLEKKSVRAFFCFFTFLNKNA